MNGLTEAHRPDFHSGASDSRVLGDDHFAEKALASELVAGRQIGLDECVEVVCKHYEVEASVLSERTRVRKYSEARAVVAWLMGQMGEETLTTIASHFNRDVATMSTAVRKLEGRLLKDDKFKEKLDAIQRNIKL